MKSRLVLLAVALFALSSAAHGQQAVNCITPNTVNVDLVGLDQPFMLNRVGASDPQGMVFALKADVVSSTTELPTPDLTPGNVMIRKDKRPRPIVLRVNVGQCLAITYTNLLTPSANTQPPTNKIQPVTRQSGVHVGGMELVRTINDDGTWAGANPNAIANPGETKTYVLYAREEGVFHMFSSGTKIASQNGQLTEGMFGAVIVEPPGAEYYRSQITNDELMRYAALRINGQIVLTVNGQPQINYGAIYPPGHPRQCQPVLKMVDFIRIIGTNGQCGNVPGGIMRTYYADLYGIITGPGAGRFTGESESFKPIQSSPDRRQPFREFVIAYHETQDAVQAFPDFYPQPNGAIGMNNTLKSGKDAFSINYGAGGIGAEILANRLGVGPMWDCIDCKFEEFFLTSWAVGDPAMVVDIPANANTLTPDTPNVRSATSLYLENCQVNNTCPPFSPPLITGPKATKVYFPDDPSNVMHSYMNDHVKFRLLHAAGTLTHVHHQHAHQWLHSPNDDDSTYLDSQMLSPSAGFTLEISYGGSGNRNKTPGDSIFHCHFYPHFAQGMWAMWRVHDMFEQGTKLNANGIPVAGARAYPDNEIKTGTPIPAIIPLPTIGMPRMPAYAWIQNGNIQLGGTCQNNAVNGIPLQNGTCTNGVKLNGFVNGAERFVVTPALQNPGYPFFIPGIAGNRPPHPPLDFACELQPDNVTCKRDSFGNILYLDGGLPRHVIANGTIAPNRERHNAWDFTKDNDTFNAIQLPEDGTAAEKAAINYFSTRTYSTVTPTGGLSTFTTNGLPRGPVQGAPFADPAVDDNGAATGTMIRYKAANIQMDVVVNKKGWHNPQQRFITLWEDIRPTLSNDRLIQPFFFRANSKEQFVEYWHTNLVPNYYELDDYQVRTPTDILGQHIHLVKFDVLASDGAANGWNYEDGTFAAQEVRERICAINAPPNNGILGLDGRRRLLVLKNIPQLGAGPDPSRDNCHTDSGKDPALDWRGAQATVQRWWPDPLMGTTGDRTIRTVFTHDHYGPSTHQQAGLYAGLLVEPEGSRWTMADGTVMGGRHDGGPTSWEARILRRDGSAYREFAMEFGDTGQAYQPTSRRTMVPYTGTPVNITPSDTPFGWADCTNSINNGGGGTKACANGTTGFAALKAQPTLIVFGPQQGTMSVNYRSEPLPFRLSGTAGQQTDWGFAFASMRRNDPQVNIQPAAKTPVATGSPFVYSQPYPGASPYDPYTPLLRAYQGDDVQVRVLVGSHLTNHHFGIHGVNWQFEPSSSTSGFRDNQGMGISEHFEFLFKMPWTAANTTTFPCPYDSGTPRPIACADYLYNPGAGQIDFGQGLWGLLRGYNTGGDRGRVIGELAPLPTNPNGGAFPVSDTTCPDGAPQKTFWVSAESPATALTYNNKVSGQPITQANPLLFVPMTANFAGKLFPNDKPEPLVLRANAGDCITVNFRNNFSSSSAAFTTVDTGTPATQPWFTFGGTAVARVVPSTYAGLHPQMVAYDVTQSSGMAIGVNPTNGVLPIGSPGTVYQYKWYAGRIGPNMVNRRITGDAVEFGTSNLLPTDFIEQPVNSMVGALVIEPPRARFVRTGNSNLQGAVVDEGTGQLLFREFVTIFQDRLQKSGSLSFKAVNYSAEPMNYRYNASISNQVPTNGLWQAYSNSLPVQNVSTNPAWGDPQTTLFFAVKGEKVRFRVAHPMGLGGFPDNIFTLHGHVWQEEPFINQSSSLGFNPKSEWIGSRDGFGPQHHFDVLVDSAGGSNKVPGDYIYEDYNNTSNGIWGLMRVLDTTALLEAELAKPAPAPVAVPLRERSQRRARQDPVIDQFHSELAIEQQREQLALEDDEDDNDDPAVPPPPPPNQK